MTVTKIRISEKPKLTKRQQRKLRNESTTWPQQPKIKSKEARNKGYLRIAGFTKGGTPKSKLNPEHDFINSPEYKFGRLLASPDARTRHNTILKLNDYLKARTEPTNTKGGLSVLDLMKLWKGMWHTLYLCDGVVVQEEVSKYISELIWSVGGTEEEDEYAGRIYLEMEDSEEYHECNDDSCCNEGDPCSEDYEDSFVDNEDPKFQEVIVEDSSGDEMEVIDDGQGDIHPAEEEDVKHCRGAHLSALFIRTYFRTLTREWSNMDKYRIDKFYSLTRLILREIYKYMKSRHWNLGIIRLFNDAIFEEILRNKTYGNGVRFHMLDICLEELAKVNADESIGGLPLTEATFLDCLEPYFAMAQRVEEANVHSRVMEKVISRFLNEFSVLCENYDPNNKDDEKSRLIMQQVHVGTVAQFLFELGSDPETEDRYRKQLYDMHKLYMKRIKSVGRDVILLNETVDRDELHENVDDENDNYVEERSNRNSDFDEGSRETTLVGKVSKSSIVKIISKDVDKSKTRGLKHTEKVSGSDTNEDLNLRQKRKMSDYEEDIILISKKEQVAAVKATAKAIKSVQTKSNIRDNENSSNFKKVKFGSTNKSKSYKASMKDLQKVDATQTLLKTPEKSILLKRKVGTTKKSKK